MKCLKYGVLCNFSFDVADLRPVSEEQASQDSVERYRRPLPVPGTIDNAIWTNDGQTLYVLDTHDWALFNKFRHRTLHSLGGAPMIDVFENHMLQKCFTASLSRHLMRWHVCH